MLVGKGGGGLSVERRQGGAKPKWTAAGILEMWCRAVVLSGGVCELSYYDYAVRRYGRSSSAPYSLLGCLGAVAGPWPAHDAWHCPVLDNGMGMAVR